MLGERAREAAVLAGLARQGHDYLVPVGRRGSASGGSSRQRVVTKRGRPRGRAGGDGNQRAAHPKA